ncbi:MAG: M48 family metallopeptidase, partial [Candidatus Omnitrophica bacterium]|nr:M48 family metallopeptidase [Candidatus Omnitrophota bacterium]
MIALGYFIGVAFFPPDGGIGGIFIALGIWGFLTLLSLTSADQILLSISGAQEITQEVHPQLYNVVEEMKIAANLPAMPRIYIIPTPAVNAFATGLRPERSAIAVTSGLLEKMNRDELQGVVAHEMGHILNHDVRFMAMAAVMLGSITLISEVFLRGMYYGGSRSRYSSGGRSRVGNGNAAMVILALVLAVLAPIFAQLLYFAISRRREYLADATGARLTRYPEGLASALEKIA